MASRSSSSFLIRNRFWVASLAIGIAIGVSSFFVWRQHLFQNWAEAWAKKEINRGSLEKLRKQLPFEIVSADIQEDWRDVMQGKVAALTLVLRRGDLLARLSGPLRFPPAHWNLLRELWLGNGDLIRVDYFPAVTAEQGRTKLPPLSLHLWVSGDPEHGRLEEFGVETAAPESNKKQTWEIPEKGRFEFQSPEFQVQWTEHRLRASIRSRSLLASSGSEKSAKTLNLNAPSLEFDAPLSLQPFQLGPEIAAEWQAGGAELLLGDRYFSIPAPLLAGKLKARLGDKPTAELSIGELELSARKSAEKIDLSWKLRPLPLTQALPAFLKATSSGGAPFSSFYPLRDMSIRQGSIATRGEAELQSGEFRSIDAQLEIAGLSFRWPSKKLAVAGLDLSTPVSVRSKQVAVRGGEIAIHRFGFKKLRGSLGKLVFSMLPEQLQPEHIKLDIGTNRGRLPLQIDGWPIQIGSVVGTTKKIETSLHLDSVGLQQILVPLCVVKPDAHLPPVTASVDFPIIEISSDGIVLTGSARADLFNGSLEARKLAFYDVLGEIPEFDFTLKLDGVRLDQLGGWAGFGDMDGVLTGYADDVVFQSWLPTQYDLLVQVKPFHHSSVVFSPEAMRNFAKLFAHDAIDGLPGYAKWMAFGWPSRLLGGYDIDYAGIHLLSEEGLIRLETLDPKPKTAARSVESGVAAPDEQKHFILHGRRFKMPLRSAHYPLVLDATTMGNFVHGMIGQLSTIAQEKKDREKAENGPSHLQDVKETKNNEEDVLYVPDNNTPEQNEADCVPGDL